MVTIIIPVYNRQRFIAEAIESILHQPFQDFEIIIVDDGSTDGTKRVIEQYLHDERISYYQQEHSGKPSVARNTGITYARGSYVCFLDSDDIMAKESITKRVAILEANSDVGIVCADWLDFKGDFSQADLMPSYVKREKMLQKLPDLLVNRSTAEGVIYNYDFIYELFYTNIIKTSTVMVRKELLDEVGLFDETITIGEDCDMWLRMGKVRRFCYLLTPLCYARSHRSNITRDRFKNFIEDGKVIEKFMKGHIIPSRSTRKRFYRRIAEFYFDGGWHFYNINNLTEARHRFLKAFRFEPTLRHMNYLVISRLSSGTITFLRRAKRRMSKFLNFGDRVPSEV